MVKSFQYAGEGIVWIFRNHRNFRIYVLAGILVLLAGFFLGITKTEYLIILFTVGIALIAEMINTSIEELTNLITLKWVHQAKIAKDVAAAMSLVAAFLAVVIGLAVFAPYMLHLIG